MYYTIREVIKKQSTNELAYKELEEREMSKEHIFLGAKLEVGKKTYSIKNITIAPGLKDEKGVMRKENFIDVIEVSKNYSPPVEEKYRRDRYRHQILKTKEGGEKTIDENGKTVREWDKEGKLIKGIPYPVLNKAYDGI